MAQKKLSAKQIVEQERNNRLAGQVNLDDMWNSETEDELTDKVERRRDEIIDFHKSQKKGK